MLIGQPGPAITSIRTAAICTAAVDRIEVRSRDLCSDLMGAVELHRILPSADDGTRARAGRDPISQSRAGPHHRGVPGRAQADPRLLDTAVASAWSRPLPINVSMPIVAVLLDLDLPSEMGRAVPLLARTAGLLAHLAAESLRPVGLPMASAGEAAVAHQNRGEAP